MRLHLLLPFLPILTLASPVPGPEPLDPEANLAAAEACYTKPQWSDKMGSHVDNFRGLFKERASTKALRPPNERQFNSKLSNFENRDPAATFSGVYRNDMPQSAQHKPTQNKPQPKAGGKFQKRSVPEVELPHSPDSFFQYEESMIGNKYNPGQLEAARSLLVNKLMTADAAKRRNPDEPEVDWEFLRFAGLRKEDVYPTTKPLTVMESEADAIGMSMKALGEEIGGIELGPGDTPSGPVPLRKRALPEEKEEQNPTLKGTTNSEATESHDSHDPDHPLAAHIHLEEMNNPKPHGDAVPLDFHPHQGDEVTHGEDQQGKPYGPHAKRNLVNGNCEEITSEEIKNSSPHGGSGTLRGGLPSSNCVEDPPADVGNPNPVVTGLRKRDFSPSCREDFPEDVETPNPMVTGGVHKRLSDAYDSYRPNSNYYGSIHPVDPAFVSSLYHPKSPSQPVRPASPSKVSYSSYLPYPTSPSYASYPSSPFTQGRVKQVSAVPQELTTISDGCNTVHLDPERLNVLVLLCEDICRYAIYAELSPDENSALLPACSKCKACGYVDPERYAVPVSASGTKLTPVGGVNEVRSGVRAIDPAYAPAVLGGRKEVASVSGAPASPTYTLSTDPTKGGSISSFFKPDGTLDTDPFMKAMEAAMERDVAGADHDSAQSWGDLTAPPKQDDDREVVEWYELKLDRKEPTPLTPMRNYGTYMPDPMLGYFNEEVEASRRLNAQREAERRKYNNYQVGADNKTRREQYHESGGKPRPYRRPPLNTDYLQMPRQKDVSSESSSHPTPTLESHPEPTSTSTSIPLLTVAYEPVSPTEAVLVNIDLPASSGVSKLPAPTPEAGQVINRTRKDGTVHSHRNNAIPLPITAGSAKLVTSTTFSISNDTVPTFPEKSAPANLAEPVNKEKIFGLGKQEIKPNREAVIGRMGETTGKGRERETKGGQDIKRGEKPKDIVIKVIDRGHEHEVGTKVTKLSVKEGEEGEKKEVEVEVKVEGGEEKEVKDDSEWEVVEGLDLAEAGSTGKRQEIRKPGKKGEEEERRYSGGQEIRRGEESPSGIVKSGLKEFVGGKKEVKEQGGCGCQGGCSCGPSCGCGTRMKELEMEGDDCTSGCGCGSGPPTGTD